MIRILLHLKEAFPQVQRITSYARSHTIARISDEDLNQMASAGLNRIHIGMESGSDKVLKMVKKGVDKATQIIAGQKNEVRIKPSDEKGMENLSHHHPQYLFVGEVEK